MPVVFEQGLRGTGTTNMEFSSAMTKEDARPTTIITGIKELDKYLKGGIRGGNVYEVVGKPATGKTHLCMKLCLNVQLDYGAKALYLDTRKDFNPARLKDFASWHLSTLLNESWSALSALTPTDMLQNVFYVDCKNLAVLMASLYNCHAFLDIEPNIKLIVIDSISHAIRSLDDSDERTKLLLELHEIMRSVIKKYAVAFVITNNLAYRRERNIFKLEAVLGKKHSQLINKRIWLTDLECFVGKTAKTKKWICNLERNNML